MPFELFVALRYLRAKRKQGFISAVTVISVIGVTTGVAALVIAMAINNGVQQDLQRHLLGAHAHVNLLEKERGFGIEDWRPFMERFREVDHVVAMAPALYGEVMIQGAIRPRGCFLKGVDLEAELQVTDLLGNLKEGSLDELEASDGLPGLLLGEKLALDLGARLDSVVTVINPQGEMTPFGLIPGYKRFRVAGIFESKFFEYNSAWAFTTLQAAQESLSLTDVINVIEFKLDDLNLAAPVGEEIERLAGPQYGATNWMERNRVLFEALEVEKFVTAFIIGLIMLVAALNILISLVMMVMEKRKDVAILMSMGARREQIRRIFMWQGVTIGILGTMLGLVLGHALCWLLDTYQVIPLQAEVYGLSYVPFAPRLWDGVAVALAAMVVSYLTTVYPSGSASRVVPVEVLRYE